MTGLAGKVVLSAGVAALALGLAGCGSKSATNAGAAVTTVAPSTTSTTEAPKPFDPTKPIDLGGEPGVTPAEQHRAEALLAGHDQGPEEVRNAGGSAARPASDPSATGSPATSTS